MLSSHSPHKPGRISGGGYLQRNGFYPPPPRPPTPPFFRPFRPISAAMHLPHQTMVLCRQPAAKRSVAELEGEGGAGGTTTHGSSVERTKKQALPAGSSHLLADTRARANQKCRAAVDQPQPDSCHVRRRLIRGPRRRHGSRPQSRGYARAYQTVLLSRFLWASPIRCEPRSRHARPCGRVHRPCP